MLVYLDRCIKKKVPEQNTKHLTDGGTISYPIIVKIVKSQWHGGSVVPLHRQGEKRVHCSKVFKYPKSELSNVPNAEVIVRIRSALPTRVAIHTRLTSVSGDSVGTRTCTGTM